MTAPQTVADVQHTPGHGDLRVWWVPQMPMTSFDVSVPDLATASLMLDTLGRYDAFQLEHRVKPDYCNAGRLLQYDADAGEWWDWECPDTFDGFDEVRADPERLARAALRAAATSARQGENHVR